MNDMSNPAALISEPSPSATDLQQTLPPGAPQPEEELLALDYEDEHEFVLSRPLERRGPAGIERLDRIRLRAPSALDVYAIKGTVTTNAWGPDGRLYIAWDTDKLNQYITRLSGLTMSVHAQM